MTNSEDTVTQQEIDRLVDGGLNEAERRVLLARLDSQPGGWRACALAFLEAEAWRAAMGSLVIDMPQQAVRPATGAAASRLGRLRLYWMSVAAGILLAFGLGSVLGSRWGDAGRAVVDRSEGPQQIAAPADPAGSDAEAAPPQETGTAPADADVQVVGLVRWGEEGAPQQAVPIVSGRGLDEDWLRAQPRLFSDHALQQLERYGWRVQQGRQLLSIELRDGRRLAIPLDSVKYQFVGHEVY
jgi:anti-sigma factor RsiW